MGFPADVEVKIEDFQGMATNADPTDLPPGLSAEQVNVNGLKRGELSLRRGLRPLTFDAEDD
jgi:hypothetical protein